MPQSLHCTNGPSGTEGDETGRIAGDLSGRGLYFAPHRAEALFFVRAAFQAEGSLCGTTRISGGHRPPFWAPLLITPAVKRSRLGGWLWSLLFVLTCFSGVVARAAEEEALMDLWKQQAATPDDHDAILKACHDFESANAGDPLIPIVRGFEEWHWLRAGHRPEALQLMTADLTAPRGPVTDGARRLALAWFTRVDREQVAAALQAYYRKNVAYPKSLDALPAEARPPMNDRFGKPWVYGLTGFAKLPGFTDQKYALRSAVLGDTSEFNAAVKLPYGSRILATPLEVITAPGNTQAVKFNVAGSAAVVGVGQSAGDLYLAFVGARIVVACDDAHWKIFPRP